MRAKKRKPTAARKRREPAPTHNCFYGFESCGIWRHENRIATADRGDAHPVPAWWEHEPKRERAGAISEAIPNADSS